VFVVPIGFGQFYPRPEGEPDGKDTPPNQQQQQQQQQQGEHKDQKQQTGGNQGGGKKQYNSGTLYEATS
jgi:hypothetical protein